MIRRDISIEYRQYVIAMLIYVISIGTDIVKHLDLRTDVTNVYKYFLLNREKLFLKKSINHRFESLQASDKNVIATSSI